GHWAINGRRVDIPSYQVRENDVITFKPGSDAETVIRDATELVAQVPAWLQADHDQLTAKVLRRPERAEIAAPVQEQLIVELSSKYRFPLPPWPRRRRRQASAPPKRTTLGP